MPTDDLRDRIRDEVSGILIGSGFYATTIGLEAGREVADAILPLVEEAIAAERERLRVPVAPLGYDVTYDMVQEVWDTFVKPSQSNDAAPQSAEMRVLIAILRGYAAAIRTPEEPTEATPEEAAAWARRVIDMKQGTPEEGKNR
ncbi:hypothetical protein [Agromyces larvae]|uniref:Uncharacterized protein n=1 Tax=Agromyces larvae TaxID=2929802 RepID=A0ABY4C376_9MICO|nr:hypothetical protein [Agromyces larvae]UOE45920.1 hypothetical protein MTO99_09325 [Agromyces larvae]